MSTNGDETPCSLAHDVDASTPQRTRTHPIRAYTHRVGVAQHIIVRSLWRHVWWVLVHPVCRLAFVGLQVGEVAVGFCDSFDASSRSSPVSESALRSYELRAGGRFPKDVHLRSIARALKVRPEVFEDYDITTADPVIHALFNLEERLGLN